MVQEGQGPRVHMSTGDPSLVSAGVQQVLAEPAGPICHRTGQPGDPDILSLHRSVLTFRRAVRALCDHTAAGPDQLSFQRGEVLRVIATVDEDWLRCGRDGVEGLVPVGYTSLVL